MARSRKLTVEVLADAKGFSKAMGEASKAGDSMGQKFQNMGKKIGIGLGLAAGGAIVLGKAAIDAAAEAQSVQRKVEAVIKSTGGAANVSGKHINKFAESMAYKIGVDDEAIKSSAAMLLTFKAVRNESGKGNRIFDRAATSMMDLASVFGSSDAAAKQLGKALSDPVKGVSALKKAGVDFTEQQKAQIKTMVESGDLLGAQRLILGEVESQVGGTAEASATAGQKMKVAFGELQEKVGGLLLPAFEKFTTFVVDKFIPGLEKFWSDHGPKIKEIFNKIKDAVIKVAHWLGEEVPKAAKKVVKWLKEKLPEAFDTMKKFAHRNKAAIIAVASAFGVLAAALIIAKGVALAMTIQTALLNAQAWLLALNPLTLTFIAIAAAVAIVVGVFVFLYQKFAIVQDACEVLAVVFKAAFAIIVWAVSHYFGLVKLQFEILATVFSWLWEKTAGLREGMVDIFASVFEGIKTALRLGWNGLVGMINPIIKKLHNLPGLSWLPADGLPLWPEGGGGSQPDQRFRNGDVTRFAAGGIVTRPMIGMVGEAGPEAIIPLGRGKGAGIGNTININVTASPLSSPADVGAAVVDALRAYERRNGSLRLRVS